MWYVYRAAYREESGGNYARLHRKMMSLTEKLISAADGLIEQLDRADALDSKDIKNISEAVLNIAKARQIQSGCLTGGDVMRYLIDAKHMEAVKEGKAALADAENTGVVILPVINTTTDEDKI